MELININFIVKELTDILTFNVESGSAELSNAYCEAKITSIIDYIDVCKNNRQINVIGGLK